MRREMQRGAAWNGCALCDGGVYSIVAVLHSGALGELTDRSFEVKAAADEDRDVIPSPKFSPTTFAAAIALGPLAACRLSDTTFGATAFAMGN